MANLHNLLNDLAEIGATIKPAGDELILCAGPAPIPATLVRRVREAKRDIMAVLEIKQVPARKAAKAPELMVPVRDKVEEERQIVEWLNRNPSPSRPRVCAHCGVSELIGAIVLPFGTEPHTWLHAECWRDWRKSRRAEARKQLGLYRDENA